MKASAGKGLYQTDSIESLQTMKGAAESLGVAKSKPQPS
jgi:hypothetical protein